MTSDHLTDRDQALRAILVTKADREGRRRPVRRRRWALSIGAFALAGALTGAAITTSAIATADQANRVFRLGAAAAQHTKALGTLIGSPVVNDGEDTVGLRLGAPPAGATRVVVAFDCFTDGSVAVTVHGGGVAETDAETVDCALDAPRVLELSAPKGAAATVSLAAAAGSRLLAWASWMRDRPVPSTSAQQEADLSDGRVTHQEYLSAYSRYAGCMAEAGYPMAPVSGTPPYVSYAVPSAAVDAGADGDCYAREFSQVDRAWQSALDAINSACLAAHGVDGDRMSLQEQLAELRLLGETLSSCSPQQG